MIEKLWEFADAQSMPNNTTAVCTYVIDWTSSKFTNMMNSGVSLWVVVTVNTVPSAGTSCTIKAYQHTTTTISSGDLLDTGDVRAIANMSANAQDTDCKHILYARELSGLIASALAIGEDQYFGLIMDASGDVSTGKIDAWLQVGKPKMPTPMTLSSNI